MSNIEQFSKAELMDEYKRVTGQDAKTAWSKAELIEQIEAERAKIQNPPADTGTTPPADPNPNPNPEPVIGDNEFVIVKKDADGNVIERQTTNADAWGLLPVHKYGWQREEPKEIA